MYKANHANYPQNNVYKKIKKFAYVHADEMELCIILPNNIM